MVERAISIDSTTGEPPELLQTWLTGAYAGKVGGAEAFVAKDDIRASGAVLAIAGDSTSDELTEWFWRGLTMWAADRPSVTVNGFYGYGDAGPYQTSTIQTGAGGYWPAPYYDDTFTRTGDVFGSTPEVGSVYGGGAGGWTADGAKAVATGTGNSADQIAGLSDPGGRRRVTLEVEFDTTPGASTQKALSISLGASAANRVELFYAVSTGGVQSWALSKVVAGVKTTIGTGVGSPLTASTVNTVDFSIELNPDGTCTGNIGASTVTGSLSAAEADAIIDAGFRTIFQTLGADSGGEIAILRAYAQKWIDETRTVSVYNGSKSGMTAQWQLDRLAGLYPVATDVLLINHGHNYGAGTVAAYLASIDALCTAFRAAHPEAGIVLCSQNPRFSPAGQITEHLNRNAALRRYAAANGYGYFPVAEFYTALSDQGRSLIQTDGVHPKRAAEAADPNNGAYQVGVLLRDYLDALSLQG
jgi:hypothetical protein